MRESLPDQRRHWTGLYAHGRRGAGSSAFVRAVAPVPPERSCVLELGCGKGDDAAYLARFGHDVIARDFVGAVVDGNRERWHDAEGLAFRVMRTDEPFPDAGDTFDVVYAHLTLHSSGVFRHHAADLFEHRWSELFEKRAVSSSITHALVPA